MNLTTTFFITGSLVLASGCAGTSFETTYDYDPSANFAALQTYSWSPGEIVGDVGQFTIERVTDITNQVLAAKGYRESGNPDFVIDMHGGKMEVHSSGWGWSGMEFNRVNQGALILHIKDASTQRTIWSGSVRGEAEPNPTPEQQTQRLTEAIHELLDRFPPK